MLPYVLLVFFPVLFSYFYYELLRKKMLYRCDYSVITEKRNKKTIFLFFLLFFVLLSLRDISIGIDLREYERIFERCQRASLRELFNMNWEPGYTVYNKLVSLITENYRLFLVVTAIIILYPIYKLYSDEKKFCFLLIILFINMPCFLMIFSGLRQAIATSIGIWVYMTLENRKYLKSILLVFLAISFHTSAVVLFLLYPAYFIKIKTKHLLFIIPVLSMVLIFRQQIFTLLLNYIPRKYIEFYGEIQQTGAIGMMLLFLVFIIFSFVVLDESVMSEKDYFMRNLLLISTLFQFFVPIHGLIQRASYYFLIFAPVSILSVVQAPQKKLKSISNIAVIIMSCFFTVYFLYNAAFSTDNLLGVFPYKFMWSDQQW